MDASLVGLFGAQHSIMARPALKKWWTRGVPEPIERSTFVLASTVCLSVLMVEWRPIGTGAVWDVTGAGAAALILVSLCGWVVVVASTFMLDHFDLFGLRQVWNAYRCVEAPEPRFSTPALYKAVRHPIYFGFMIAFWSTPTMTLGHLVFASAMTGYVFFAIRLEERDLVSLLGDAYREYQARVPMLLPWRSRGDRT